MANELANLGDAYHGQAASDEGERVPDHGLSGTADASPYTRTAMHYGVDVEDVSTLPAAMRTALQAAERI